MAAPEVIKRRVDALIANTRTRWSEADRHLLEGQNEAFLIRLEQQPVEAPPPAEMPPPRIYEAFEGLDSEATAELVDEYVRRKEQALAALAANTHCVFSEAELRGMTAKKLEGILDMMGEPVPGRAPLLPMNNYNGRRMPPLRIVQTDETDAPPNPPDTMALVVEERRRMGLM